MDLVLCADIGGSHITAALVNSRDLGIVGPSVTKQAVNPDGSPGIILSQWVDCLRTCLASVPHSELDGDLLGISVALPGPFAYDEGYSLIDGVGKFGSLYGIHVKQAFQTALDVNGCVMANDAACFGVGCSLTTKAQKIVAVTLGRSLRGWTSQVAVAPKTAASGGTGFGGSFIEYSQVIANRSDVPRNGYVYNLSYNSTIAEDYVSPKWILARYAETSASQLASVEQVHEAAKSGCEKAVQTLCEYGDHIASSLAASLRKFGAEELFIGGGISHASEFFLESLQRALDRNGVRIQVTINLDTEGITMAGAAALFIAEQKAAVSSTIWRTSLQPLMPNSAAAIPPSENYRIYPFHSMRPDVSRGISRGWSSLARNLKKHRNVLIDGYSGTDWSAVRIHLAKEFRRLDCSVVWFEAKAFQFSGEHLTQMVNRFMGESGSVWGSKATISLEDFYDLKRIAGTKPDYAFQLNVVIGIGAGLFQWEDSCLMYVDLPKNELQYRMRASTKFQGIVPNIGSSQRECYKQQYFVDWPVLQKYKRTLMDRIDVLVDGQWRDEITWSHFSDVKTSLANISRDVFRVRPWFEPGVWGGQFLKDSIPTLNQAEANYAWSFELIATENGIVLERQQNLMEISLEWLMLLHSEEVLGVRSSEFEPEFPIRFDYLDTMDGQGLSIQVHPTLSYIRENFGENITQDETYYIMECKPGSEVFLGFQEGVSSAEFSSEVANAEQNGTETNISKYVQRHSSKKHDLFLIPNGTVHGSGRDNLVLEISSLPYIYTFKMYDWNRLDLDGKPRPINIEHGVRNLDFSRQGKRVAHEFISVPQVLKEEKNYKLLHLRTHQLHFYDICRHDFEDRCEINVYTEGSCHVLMVVEGDRILVQVGTGDEKEFRYMETFIVPAAARQYFLKVVVGSGPVKVIQAFLKPPG